MTMQKYNYDELGHSLLKYLYSNRHEENAGRRVISAIKKHFNISTATFNAVAYELKGKSLVNIACVTNSKVWFLTDKGVLYVEKNLRNTDE